MRILSIALVLALSALASLVVFRLWEPNSTSSASALGSAGQLEETARIQEPIAAPVVLAPVRKPAALGRKPASIPPSPKARLADAWKDAQSNPQDKSKVREAEVREFHCFKELGDVASADAALLRAAKAAESLPADYREPRAPGGKTPFCGPEGGARLIVTEAHHEIMKKDYVSAIRHLKLVVEKYEKGSPTMYAEAQGRLKELYC